MILPETRVLENISISETRFRFRLKGAVAFPMIDPNKEGIYEAGTALRLNVRCGVLCRSNRANEVNSYLQEICRSVTQQIELKNSLPGWTLFHDFVPFRSAKPPYGLDLLSVDNALLIRPVGGLRLGRAQEWLLGAPPRIIELLGEHVPEEVLINGNAHQVSDPVGEKFSDPGFYIIVAGKERYSLRIVEANLNADESHSASKVFLADTEEIVVTDTNETLQSAVDRITGSVMPPFGLHLIGPTTCQTRTPFSFLADSLPSERTAQWAVGRIDGIMSIVALRQKPLPPTNTSQSVMLNGSWSETVLQATFARLGILESARYLTRDAQRERADVKASWQAYLVAAARVRRNRRSRLKQDCEETP